MREVGCELAERDEQDQDAADGVREEHQPFLVVPVGVDPSQWAEEDRRKGVGEEERGAMGTGAADAVGQDQQGEHQKLVGKLGSDLG